MVLCTFCKETKDNRVSWVIQEHSVDNALLHNFKICDDCAAKLIRQIVADMKLSVNPDAMTLNYTGLIGDVTLAASNELEVVLLMDLAKARKAVMDKVDGKADARAEYKAEAEAKADAAAKAEEKKE